MSLTIILAILFIHWIADFWLQTDWQAKNKSTDNNALLNHTVIYSSVWAIIGVFLMFFGLMPFTPIGLLWFVIATLTTHTIIDFFTSRFNSYLYQHGEIHYFFVAIGFDQLLHYTQLLVCYKYLIQ